VQSEEVRKELPEATQRFAKIDEVVRAVLGEFAATKNVVACCTKEGLLKHLEAQQGELELCEKVGGQAAGRKCELHRQCLLGDSACFLS